jgi:glycosyltransferase involved in cell wall biosynthesis
VNVVTKLGWILERLALEVHAASVNCIGAVPGMPWPGGVAPERQADPKADVNYYIPARDFSKFPCPGKAVGMYTHGETGFDLIPKLAACVTMNQDMATRLRAAGATRVVTIRPGTEAPSRRPVFGVLGRVYGKKRKGADLVLRAVKEGFDFRACTDFAPHGRKESPCPVTHKIQDRDAFLDSIDYLVVTSTDEGGPMPVLEAIARHVPVIAPRVGWCWEFPVIRYEVGSWSSLRGVLRALSKPPSWRAWREQHDALWASL